MKFIIEVRFLLSHFRVFICSKLLSNLDKDVIIFSSDVKTLKPSLLKERRIIPQFIGHIYPELFIYKIKNNFVDVPVERRREK